MSNLLIANKIDSIAVIIIWRLTHNAGLDATLQLFQCAIESLQKDVNMLLVES